MNQGRPLVSVVVPTRDRPGPLARCLGALGQQTYRPFDVVVVDDGSRDPRAVAAVVAAAPNARVVAGRGIGPAAARNTGVAATTSAVVCFTDDDCLPDRRWVEVLVQRIDGGSSVVAGPTRNVDDDDPFAAASQLVTNHLVDASLERDQQRVRFAPTSNLACRAGVMRSVPFDERYPLAAGEDRAWCASIARKGVAVDFEPAAVVWHHPALSWTTFWRQHVRYGRGAYRFHRAAPAGARLRPAAFYVGLLRRGFAIGTRAGVLVGIAQVATAAGVALGAWDDRRRP